MKRNEIDLVAGFAKWLDDNRLELINYFRELREAVPVELSDDPLDFESFAYEVYVEL